MEDKRYYVEWVIVADDANVGDFVKNRVTGVVQHVLNAEDFALLSSDDKRANLYMCDSQVYLHDMVYCYMANISPYYGKITQFSSDHSLYEVKPTNTSLATKVFNTHMCTKVVGKIDPKATWIKQGDRYSEEELLRRSVSNSTEIISTRRVGKNHQRLVKKRRTHEKSPVRIRGTIKYSKPSVIGQCYLVLEGTTWPKCE